MRHSICTCGLEAATVSESNSDKPAKVLHLNGSLVLRDKQGALNKYVEEGGTMVLDVFAYVQELIRTQRGHLEQQGYEASFQNMEKVWKANHSRLLRKVSLHLHPDKALSAAQITSACLTEASQDTACCSSPQPASGWQRSAVCRNPATKGRSEGRVRHLLQKLHGGDP